MPIDSEAHYDDCGDYQQRVIEITKYAHNYGVGVEAELDKLPDGGNGCVVEEVGSGSVVNGARVSAAQSHAAKETDPQKAASFVEATGVDLLAVSVGNVHVQLDGRTGLYLERLDAIQKAVSVPLVWHGGFKSQHQVVRPVRCYSQLRDYDLLVARIKALHQQGKRVPAIAEQLNLEGFTTPSRRTVFSTGTLAPIMKRLGLRGERYFSGLLGPNEWWIRGLATKLKAPIHKVYY